METYQDRHDAGQILATHLSGLDLPADTAVLGLARGGVICARPVAEALGVRVDVLLVRKLGVPSHPELAFGAIATGGFQVLNPAVATTLSSGEMELVAGRERKELERREREYGATAADLKGRVVVLVDDGLATGATMRVAIQAVRSQLPAKVIVAVPVAAPDALRAIEQLVDEVVCPLAPIRFRAVGEWYDNFRQVSDRDVIEVLSVRPR